MSRFELTSREQSILPARSVTRREALRFVMGAGLASLVLPTAANALTTQQKLDAAQLDYDQAQAELDSIAEEYASIAAELATTQDQVASVQSQIDDLQSQIDAKQTEIDAKQAEVDVKQAEVEAKQAQLGERMSSSYKSGTQSTLDLLLSSTSFEELTSNIYYLDKVNEADEKMISEVKTLKAQLETQKAELETQKAELETQQAELEAQKAELSSLQATQESQLATAEAKQAESQELVDSLSDEVKELMEQREAELIEAQKEAERIAAAEAAAKASGTTYKGSAATNTQTITGSGSLQDLINASYQEPTAGSGRCAAWVNRVFARAGLGDYSGNACDLYRWYCHYDFANIQPGMIVATSSAPYGSAVATYGHVGIYIGNNTVRECRSGVVMSSDLSSWQAMYSKTVPARCGWQGGIVLS